jgi:glutamate dehydrogenase (NAD(P)+)
MQDQYSHFWTEERVRETFEQTMRTAFAGVYAAAERFRTDMRIGAYILAVGRVAEATRLRGIFP